MNTEFRHPYDICDIEDDFSSVFIESIRLLSDGVSKYNLKKINRYIKDNITNIPLQKKIHTLINVYIHYGVTLSDSTAILYLEDKILKKMNSKKVKEHPELSALAISLLKSHINEDEFVEAINLTKPIVREETKLLRMLKKVVDKSNELNLSGDDLEEFKSLVGDLKYE